MEFGGNGGIRRKSVKFTEIHGIQRKRVEFGSKVEFGLFTLEFDFHIELPGFTLEFSQTAWNPRSSVESVGVVLVMWGVGQSLATSYWHGVGGGFVFVFNSPFTIIIFFPFASLACCLRSGSRKEKKRSSGSVWWERSLGDD